MRGKPHNPTSAARSMTKEEREIAQWRIDVTQPGDWIINDIYAEYWDGQPDQKRFGGVFKKAVIEGKLKNIDLLMENDMEILSSDGQLLYRVR